MPRPGEHTPITDDEAEDMIRRFALETEDIEMLAGETEWAEFVTSKLFTEKGYVPSGAQYARMESVREMALKDIGFTTERMFPEAPWRIDYRDIATGRFISRPEALYKLTVWRR